METKAPYHAYVIRLWPTRLGGDPGYRVSLQDVATGQTMQLPNLEGLFSFLKDSCSAEHRGDRTPDREEVGAPEAPSDSSSTAVSDVPPESPSHPPPEPSPRAPDEKRHRALDERQHRATNDEQHRAADEKPPRAADY